MIQWLQIFPYVVDTPLYIACFVLKMIGAVGLFGITFMLALPLEKLQGMQRRRGFWSALNIVCGLTILIGAGLMRSAVKIYP